MASPANRRGDSHLRGSRVGQAILVGSILCLCGACRTDLPDDGQPVVEERLDRDAAEFQRETPAEEPPVGVSTDDDWFEDVTPQSGVDFVYRNGRDGQQYFILESLGGGVALLDYDRDGDSDLFFTGGGTIGESDGSIRGLPSALYRNEGDWRFVDVTAQTGVGNAKQYTHGCTVGDYDCDGWPDLFVCGYNGWYLLHNTGGGQFRDVTAESGLVGHKAGWNTAALFADIDGDALPDLYVVRYLEWTPETDVVCRNRHGHRQICSPGQFQGASDRLFRNLGDGKFEDISSRAGLSPGGNGLGAVAADANRDGWIDLYVANDETNNFLYLGGPELQLRESGLVAGVATNEYGMHDGSMGVDAADYDGDGDLDLWVTNFEAEDNALYENIGPASFKQSTVITGLAGQSRRLVGFGTGFADFDLDGWLDLFVVNGHVFYQGGHSPYAQPAQLFHNREGKRFANVAAQGGDYFRTTHAARGAAVGDLDNDGALDLVVVHQNRPVTLLRNRKTIESYICVEVVGTTGNRDAVGARVSTVYQERELVRWIVSGAGYFSHSDRRIVLPTSDDKAGVTIVWPAGQRERFSGLSAGRVHTLVEGRGEPQTSP